MDAAALYLRIRPVFERVLVTSSGLFFGFALTSFGSVYHRISFPWGSVAAISLIAVGLVATRKLVSRHAGDRWFAVGIILAVTIFAGGAGESSVLILSDLPGLVFCSGAVGTSATGIAWSFLPARTSNRRQS